MNCAETRWFSATASQSVEESCNHGPAIGIIICGPNAPASPYRVGAGRQRHDAADVAGAEHRQPGDHQANLAALAGNRRAAALAVVDLKGRPGGRVGGRRRVAGGGVGKQEAAPRPARPPADRPAGPVPPPVPPVPRAADAAGAGGASSASATEGKPTQSTRPTTVPSRAQRAISPPSRVRSRDRRMRPADGPVDAMRRTAASPASSARPGRWPRAERGPVR